MKNEELRTIHRFLTTKEAAEYLGLKVSYIYNLVQKGRIKAHKCGNTKQGGLRFTIEELNRFLGVNHGN